MSAKKPSEKKKPVLTDSVKTLEGKLQKLQKELQEKQDKLLRSYAEFQNYQKRMEKDLTLREEETKKRYLTELLDLSELLSKTLTDNNPKEGITLILKQLNKLFEKEKITPIDSLGKPFDHQVHYALSTIEREGITDGQIVEEVKKGYLLDGKLLRPSQVIVAKKQEK